MGKPAIVLAMVIAPEGDLAAGKAAAPVVVSVKFIDAALLQTIGSHLQLSGLHAADESGQKARTRGPRRVLGRSPRPLTVRSAHSTSPRTLGEMILPSAASWMEGDADGRAENRSCDGSR